MDKAGRVVIPKDVRDRLGADETTRFKLELVLDRLELTPKASARAQSKVVEKDGVWVVEGMGKPVLSVVEAIEQDRRTRDDHLSGPGIPTEK